MFVAFSFRTQSTFEMTDGFIAGCLVDAVYVFSPALGFAEIRGSRETK